MIPERREISNQNLFTNNNAAANAEAKGPRTIYWFKFSFEKNYSKAVLFKAEPTIQDVKDQIKSQLGVFHSDLLKKYEGKQHVPAKIRNAKPEDIELVSLFDNQVVSDLSQPAQPDGKFHVRRIFLEENELLNNYRNNNSGKKIRAASQHVVKFSRKNLNFAPSFVPDQQLHISSPVNVDCNVHDTSNFIFNESQNNDLSKQNNTTNNNVSNNDSTIFQNAFLTISNKYKNSQQQEDQSSTSSFQNNMQDQSSNGSFIPFYAQPPSKPAPPTTTSNKRFNKEQKNQKRERRGRGKNIIKTSYDRASIERSRSREQIL